MLFLRLILSATDDYGDTALHIAANHNDEGVMRILLTAGNSDPNIGTVFQKSRHSPQAFDFFMFLFFFQQQTMQEIFH